MRKYNGEQQLETNMCLIFCSGCIISGISIAIFLFSFSHAYNYRQNLMTTFPTKLPLKRTTHKFPVNNKLK
jgi:hypothetical protein